MKTGEREKLTVHNYRAVFFKKDKRGENVEWKKLGSVEVDSFSTNLSGGKMSIESKAFLHGPLNCSVADKIVFYHLSKFTTYR